MSAARVVAAVLAAVTVCGIRPSEAQEDHRYEVTVVVGASVLDLGTTSEGLGDLVVPFETFLPPGLRDLIPTDFEQRSELGGSVLFGFQVARRLGSRAWIETNFLVAPSHSLREDVSFGCPAQVCALFGISSFDDFLATDERVVAYHYGLDLAYELTRGEVRPFVSAGLGAVTYDVGGRGETSLAFDVGAGARFGLGERIGARLEVADRILLDHFLGGGTEHDLQVRAGIAFRLP